MEMKKLVSMQCFDG